MNTYSPSLLGRILLLTVISVPASLFHGCKTCEAPAEKTTRYAWVTGLKPEKADYYRKLHAAPWPGVVAKIRDCHIRNFNIYEREIEGKTYLVATLEDTGADFAADMKKMGDDPETQRWWKETDPCQSPLPDAAAKGKIWSDTRELMHLD